MEYVYILLLNNNKYYVGWTKNIIQRLQAHKSKSKSSIWVNEHGFQSVLEIITGNRDLEQSMTEFYMRMYGWENVRGGSYCSLVIKRPIFLNDEPEPPHIIAWRKQLEIKRQTQLPKQPEQPEPPHIIAWRKQLEIKRGTRLSNQTETPHITAWRKQLEIKRQKRSADWKPRQPQ